jgi:hypothetical protein
MGVQIVIEDNTGWQCSGRERRWYRSDSKHFARTLLDTPFWNAIGYVCGISVKELTFVVPGEAVPDELSHLYSRWDDFYQSRFQPIDPLIISLTGIVSFITSNADWLQQFQHEWFKHEELAEYYYDDYFPEGYFLEDLGDTLQILQTSRNSGASSVCISFS